MNTQLTVKTNYKGDIRKIRIENKRYNWLRKSIIKTYSLDDLNFKLVYVDEDEDKITIGNLNDLNLALETVPSGKLLKIYVKLLKDSPIKQEPKQINNEQPKEGEKLIPLMKLQKPKPQPKEGEEKKEEKLLPLMKLQKPKPQPKQVKEEAVESEKKEEKLLPLMKLQKPKPQPKQAKEEIVENKEEKLLPLMKLQKPKPQPKQVKVESEKKEEKLLPLMKLQKPKKEKIPIVPINNENIEQVQQTTQFPFNENLKDLVLMGFEDNTQLRSLLVSNNGNLEATVNQLLN